MNEANNRAEDVVLYEADTTLKKKLGRVPSLEAVLLPQMAVAEKVATAMEPQLLAELMADIKLLQDEAANLTRGVPAGTVLPAVISRAFAIKSRAGMCGYPLASALAKSLHVFCETVAPDQPIGTREIEIVNCLVKAVKTVFDLKVTGTGGDIGDAIQAELRRLAMRFR